MANKIDRMDAKADGELIVGKAGVGVVSAEPGPHDVAEPFDLPDQPTEGDLVVALCGVSIGGESYHAGDAVPASLGDEDRAAMIESGELRVLGAVE